MVNSSEISVSQLPAGVRSIVQSKGVVVDDKVSSEILQKLLLEIGQSSVYSLELKDEAQNILTNLNNGSLQSLNGNANWGNFDQLNFSSGVIAQPDSDKAEVNKGNGESEQISGWGKIKKFFRGELEWQERFASSTMGQEPITISTEIYYPTPEEVHDAYEAEIQRLEKALDECNENYNETRSRLQSLNLSDEQIKHLDVLRDVNDSESMEILAKTYFPEKSLDEVYSLVGDLDFVERGYERTSNYIMKKLNTITEKEFAEEYLERYFSRFK